MLLITFDSIYSFKKTLIVSFFYLCKKMIQSRKRKAPPQDPLHSVWRKVRGPFRTIKCQKHAWERYDIQRAGCRNCGAQHSCKATLFESDCDLVHLDDGGVCCSITGFCIPVVRYSDNEYLEGVSYTHDREGVKQSKVTFDEVMAIVKWFLVGSLSISCKKEEVDRSIARVQTTSVKVLKQHKLATAHAPAKRLPCFLAMLAQTLHQLKLKHFCRPSHSICSFCATHITQCLNTLKPTNMHSRKVNLVLGMLYLMKQGLVIQNKQWLPKTPELINCLPHETSLEKVFKLSMKLVCETENEIKLALRQQVKLV